MGFLYEFDFFVYYIVLFVFFDIQGVFIFFCKMIDLRMGFIIKLDKNDNIILGINSWFVFICIEDQKISYLVNDMEEVEMWIQCFLLV